jgi:hypothetical protein
MQKVDTSQAFGEQHPLTLALIFVGQRDTDGVLRFLEEFRKRVFDAKDMQALALLVYLAGTNLPKDKHDTVCAKIYSIITAWITTYQAVQKTRTIDAISYLLGKPLVEPCYEKVIHFGAMNILVNCNALDFANCPPKEWRNLLDRIQSFKTYPSACFDVIEAASVAANRSGLIDHVMGVAAEISNLWQQRHRTEMSSWTNGDRNKLRQCLAKLTANYLPRP